MEEKFVETPVAALLLVTASVVLACVVVTFAVNTMAQTTNTQNMPEYGHLKTLVNQLLNETNALDNSNGSLPQAPELTP